VAHALESGRWSPTAAVPRGWVAGLAAAGVLVTGAVVAFGPMRTSEQAALPAAPPVPTMTSQLPPPDMTATAQPPAYPPPTPGHSSTPIHSSTTKRPPATSVRPTTRPSPPAATHPTTTTSPDPTIVDTDPTTTTTAPTTTDDDTPPGLAKKPFHLPPGLLRKLLWGWGWPLDW
jgi:hypothetical protein